MKNSRALDGVLTKKPYLLEWITIIAIAVTNISAFVLCFNKVFYYDDAYTIALAGRSIPEIIEITSQDVHSPFYYIIIHLICVLTKLPVFFVAKFLSLLFYDLYLGIGGYFVKNIYGKKVCLYWLLFSAFMPPMIIQMTNARMYTMGLFFVTMSLGLAYKCYKDGTLKDWILFTLSSLCGVYVHTFTMIALFFLYLVLFAAIIKGKRYKKIIPYAISGGGVALAYIPWLIVLYHQMARWSGYEDGWSNTIAPLSLEQLISWVFEWTTSLLRPQIWDVAYSLLVAAVTIFFLIKYVYKEKDVKPLIGPGIACTIVCIGIVIGLLIVPCFLGRYIFCLFGTIYLAFAIGMECCKNKRVKSLIITGLIVIGILANADIQRLYDQEWLSQYMSFMEKNLEEDDIIMADSYFCLSMSIYHPENRHMIYGGMPDCIPFKCEKFQRWEQLEGVDKFWYIQFEGLKRADLSAQFEEKECLRFENAHYEVIIKQMIRKAD